MSIFPSSWDKLLGHPFEREPHRGTLAAAEAAAAAETVYPPREDWFAALRLTPPERVRVVILGQDPYHEPGQAMGLAFSVRPGVKLPPSLRNIYKELEADLGRPAPATGDLSPWAEQGVLLLNTVLTVAAGRANSHKSLGWQALTGELLSAVAALPQPIAFLLWGEPAKRAYNKATGTSASSAESPVGSRCESRTAMPEATSHAFGRLRQQATGDAIQSLPPGGKVPPQGADEGTSDALPGPRLILEAPHPSPLSAYRGFFGSKPFSQINAFLTAHGEAPIRWSAP